MSIFELKQAAKSALLRFLDAVGPHLVRRRPAPALDPSRVRSLLLVQWRHFGDLLTFWPAIERARELFPRARITWMTYRGYARFLTEAGIVDEVWSPRWRWAALLRSRPRFDLAIESHGHALSLSRLLGRRHARWLAGNSSQGHWLLDIEAMEATEATNALDAPPVPVALRHVRLMETAAHAVPSAVIPSPRLLPAASWTRAAQPWLDRLPAGFLILHPGCGRAAKRWPLEYWHALARDLNARGFALLFTGNHRERALCAGIATASPALRANLAGETDWSVLAGLVAAASAVIAPDTGIIHLAQALGTPTVALFGPIDPRVWGYDDARHRSLVHRLPCSYCRRAACPRVPRGAFSPCLQAILPAHVLAALDEVLAPRQCVSSAATAVTSFAMPAANSGAGGSRLATR